MSIKIYLLGLIYGGGAVNWHNVFYRHVFASIFSLLCLYCEKTFKDRFTLKEHMRKKLHKRLNPNNTQYDKYYLVNYLVSKLCHTVQI